MNNTLPIVIELDIPDNTEDIFNFIQSVLAKILSHKSLNGKQQSRIKMILVELVTNSIKHSRDDQGQIKLVIDHPTLSIQKYEKGLQIEFTSAHQQIPFVEIDKTLKVAFSEKNKHMIQPIDQYQFQFLNRYSEDLDIAQMPEHFGFYIITVASDSFIYQYDPEAKENRFIVNLNL